MVEDLSNCKQCTTPIYGVCIKILGFRYWLHKLCSKYCYNSAFWVVTYFYFLNQYFIKLIAFKFCYHVTKDTYMKQKPSWNFYNCLDVKHRWSWSRNLMFAKQILRDDWKNPTEVLLIFGGTCEMFARKQCEKPERFEIIVSAHTLNLKGRTMYTLRDFRPLSIKGQLYNRKNPWFLQII